MRCESAQQVDGRINLFDKNGKRAKVAPRFSVYFFLAWNIIKLALINRFGWVECKLSNFLLHLIFLAIFHAALPFKQISSDNMQKLTLARGRNFHAWWEFPSGWADELRVNIEINIYGNKILYRKKGARIKVGKFSEFLPPPRRQWSLWDKLVQITITFRMNTILGKWSLPWRIEISRNFPEKIRWKHFGENLHKIKTRIENTRDSKKIEFVQLMAHICDCV